MNLFDLNQSLDGKSLSLQEALEYLKAQGMSYRIDDIVIVRRISQERFDLNPDDPLYYEERIRMGSLTVKNESEKKKVELVIDLDGRICGFSERK